MQEVGIPDLNAVIKACIAHMTHCLDRAVTWTIKNTLDRLPKEDGADSSPVQIGLATYDRSIQFYNLHVCCGLWQVRPNEPTVDE